MYMYIVLYSIVCIVSILYCIVLFVGVVHVLPDGAGEAMSEHHCV